jgi:uncharacterized protein involved in response to NO
VGQAPPVAPAEQAPPAWLALGFRPFFLLGSLWASLLIVGWVPLFLGYLQLPIGLPPTLWHAHEMMFGFVGAIIAGFLLTAVPNWTGIATPRGVTLAALAALWVAGRMVSTLGGAGMPLPLIALDLAFLPAVGCALAGPLLKARQPHNLVFLPLLGVLTLANALMWSGTGHVRCGLYLGLYGILLMIVLIGGRVIPFFTDRALGTEAQKWPWVEKLAVATLVGCVLCEVLQLPSPPVFALGAMVHLTRLRGWFQRGVCGVPLLWILHLSYACLPLGLALRAASILGIGTASLALHVLTVGCIGCMILGMMARVALGHTGRELKPARATVIAFGLALLATVVRALLPILAPEAYVASLWAAGLLWALSFGIFFHVYLPILTQPRADGKAG